MGSIKLQEPSKSPSEKEHARQHILTPHPDATPEQIRTYLTHLLTNKRKLPDDYVRPIVARWQLGSGQELRSYSPAMYLRIFGHEDGWIIYREVNLAELNEESRSKTMLQRNWPYILPAVALSYTSLVIILIMKDVLQVDLAVVALVLGLFASVCSVLGAVLCYITYESPEQRVDAALYACTKQIVTQTGDSSNPVFLSG